MKRTFVVGGARINGQIRGEYVNPAWMYLPAPKTAAYAVKKG